MQCDIDFKQPHDLVWVNGKEQEVSRIHHYGKRVILLPNRESIGINKVTKHYSVGSLYVKSYIKNVMEVTAATPTKPLVGIPA